MQKNEQSNFPGLLGFILARLLGTPSLRETKGFTEETEERIPRLQTRHVGVSTSVIATPDTTGVPPGSVIVASAPAIS